MERELIEKAAEYNILLGHRTIDRNIGGRDLAEFGKLNFVEGAEWQAKQSPWISVKKRLPDDQCVVLVRGESGGMCTAYLHGKKSGFITYGEEAYNKFGEITHWMEIKDI